MGKGTIQLNTGKKLLRPLFWSIFLTILFLLPLIINFKNSLYSHDDGLFISWTINEVTDKLINFKNIYQQPILSNYENTLTFSDPFLSTALLTIPIKLFTDNIIFIHNLHLLIGSIATFLSFYLLADYLFKDQVSALLSSIFFSFSSLHLRYLVHLHTFLIAGIPISIYFFYKWIKENKTYQIILSIFFFLYQILNAPMTGMFLLFIYMIIFISEKNIRYTLFQRKKLTLSLLLLTLLISGLFYYPYFISAMVFDSQRTIRDAAHFSANLENLFSWEIVLAVFLFFYLKLKSQSDTQPDQKNHQAILSSKTFFVIALIGAVLMLGPVLKINQQTFKIFNLPIPLPYAIVYYIIPGMKAFRATSRWIVLVNFGLSLLIGYQLSQSNLKAILKKILIVTLSIFLFVIQIDQYPLVKIDQQLPNIYQQLENYPGQTLLEFPAYTWDIRPLVSQESIRLMYQTQHRLNLFNGTSGFIPKDRELAFHDLDQNFPNEQTINYLRNQSVSLVLVHFDQYFQLKEMNYFNQIDDLKSFRDRLEKQPNLSRISCDSNSCLYQIK